MLDDVLRQLVEAATHVLVAAEPRTDRERKAYALLREANKVAQHALERAPHKGEERNGGAADR